MNQLKGYCTLALILYFLLSGQQSLAQNSNAQLIPKVIPPSPEVASLGRFGIYPVSYFTGLVNIEVPIHQIVVGDISVPIAIQYHSAGIKVTDRSSWVGLGWSLNAGGSISRKVSGIYDEAPQGLLNNPQSFRLAGSINTDDENDLLYLRAVNFWESKDAEPDIYSYSFLGRSGQFLFNPQNNLKPVIIPYAPIKIGKTVSENNLTFELTDELGTNYKFNEVFESTNNNTPTTIRSAWMLSKIISTSKQDSIRFNYLSRSGQTNADVTDYITVNDVANNYWGYTPYTSDQGVLYNKSEYVDGNEQKISEIIFPLGKIVFTPSSSDRQDGFAGQKKLDKITIYDLDLATNTYSINKSVVFHQSYFTSTDGTNTKRLKLDSLSFLDANNVVINRYRFEYNTANILPGFTSKSRDYWGYYNGQSNNTLVPRMEIPWQSTSTASATTIWIGSSNVIGREAQPDYMQACTLKKIFFPTGGFTEFTYETNQYQQSGVSKYAGGLRIKQVKSYSSTNAIPVIKTYKYGDAETGYGRANFTLNNYSFQTSYDRRLFRYQLNAGLGNCPTVIGRKRVRTFVSSPSIEIEPYDGSPVVYPVVTEYEGDDVSNIGKTVYTFQDQADNLSSVIAIGTPVIMSYHFNRGHLIDKSIFRKLTSGYQIVSKTTNTYGAYADSTFYVGLKVKKQTVSDYEEVTWSDDDVNLGPLHENLACSEYNDTNSYLFANYSVRTGDTKLLSTTQTTYDQTDQAKIFVTTTTYQYNNYNHQQVTSTSTTNSVGETLTSSIKYPHESSGSVYTEMIQKNLLAYPVEEKTTRNSTQLEKITRNYFKFSDYVFEPQTIYRQIKNGNDDLEITFTGYDLKGNILGYVSKENVPQTFLWGYKNNYPIAAAVGASQGEIFYTSFEEGTSSSISANAAKTGNRSWWNTAYTTPTMNAGTYKLTYWRKVGATQWEYVETTISGSTTIGGLNTYVDEVRICPVKARMTTYTFKPGIGMTSMIDTNNQIISYEYDAFSRLNTIRDFNKDILKRYVYNYKK